MSLTAENLSANRGRTRCVCVCCSRSAEPRALEYFEAYYEEIDHERSVGHPLRQVQNMVEFQSYTHTPDGRTVFRIARSAQPDAPLRIGCELRPGATARAEAELTDGVIWKMVASPSVGRPGSVEVELVRPDMAKKVTVHVAGAFAAATTVTFTFR